LMRSCLIRHKSSYPMKFLIVLFHFLMISAVSHCQKNTKEFKWPGFIQLNDSIFISQTEISIKEYAEYLNIMKIFFGSYSHFEEALPSANTLGWKAYDPFSKLVFSIDQLYEVIDSTHMLYQRTKEKIIDTNVTYLAFISNRPIVNITKQQALLYCDLRTKAFPTLKKNVRKEKGWQLPDSVYFRLPTQEEWATAFNDIRDSLKQSSLNKTHRNNILISRQYFDSLGNGELIPASVYAGYVNPRGIINLCGNVAEMLMDSPYAFGGSYSDLIQSCSPFLKSILEPPMQNIGFRIVAVKVK